MTATTYDLTDPRTDYCAVEAVGEFAYDRTLRKLVRQLGVRQREETFFTASLIPEPDNPHSEHHRALSIRWNGQVIGYLPEDESAEYQQIRRVVASGFTPTVRARLWYFTGDDRTNRYWLSLNLRTPEQLVPLNDPPVEGWTLLPAGATVQVTKEADHLDVLLDHVPPSGTGQLLVTLHQFTAGTRTHWEGIEVRLDGERIGELTKATSAKFLAAVQHFDAIGLTTVARATIKGSALSAEVTLQAAKAHELTDADLEPVVCPLPRLVPFQPDAADYPVPNAYIPTMTEKVASAARRKVREVISPTPAPVPPGTPAPEPPVAQTPPETTTPANTFSTQGEPHVPAQPTPTQQPEYTVPATPPLHPVTPATPTSPAESADPVPKSEPTVAGTIAAIEDIHTRRPGLISTVLLWCGAIFGGIVVLGSFGSFGDSVTYALGMLFLGAAIALACAWPLRCRSADKRALTTWEEENRRTLELRESLPPQHDTIAAGLTSTPRPTPVTRQWKKVGTVAAVLAVIGVALFSAGSEGYDEATRPDYGSVDN